MGILHGDERDQLIKLLQQLPNIDDSAVRRVLLAGLPAGLRQTIQFSGIALAELNAILDAADSDVWMQLPDGSWATIRVIENARSIVAGSKLELQLQKISDALGARALSQDELARIHEALEGAFPSQDDVGKLVKSGYGQALETISDGVDLTDVIGDVIDWAERRGRNELLRKALTASPKHAALNALATQFGLVSTGGPPVLGADTGTALGTPSDLAERRGAALSQVFSLRELRQMVRARLGVDLDGVAKGSSLAKIAASLASWSEEQGRTDSLLLSALAERPSSAELRQLALERNLSTITVQDQDTAGLGQLGDLDAWLARLHVASQAVCRVEVSGSGVMATGFLVGPDLVLTAYSAVEKVSGGVLPRFGYRKGEDESSIELGTTYSLAEEWLIDSSPSDKLDFALLRVNGRPGDDSASGVAGAAIRRWLVASSAPPPAPGDALACIQHADGGPLQIAFEQNAVVGLNPKQTRLTYRLNTRPGSAGAPVFDREARLVAIHSGRSATDAELKQGALVTAIFAREKVRAALDSVS